jgi:hypothetical protein
LKLGVITSCVTGILQHDVTLSGGFMNSIFKAFTMQSNIWVASICFVFLIATLFARGKTALPDWLYVLKFMFTTSVLLTWFVFAVLLTPLMPAAYLVSSSNLFLHNLTPILALLDFTNFETEYLPRKKQIWTVLIMPLLYMIFFFSAYALTGELPVPYFFLDYQTLGWFSFGSLGPGVVYWIGMLLLVLLGLGGLARELKSRCQEQPLRVSLAALALMIGLPLASALISLS